MGPKCQRCRIHRPRRRRECHGCGRFVGPGCKPERCLAVDGMHHGGISVCRDCHDASCLPRDDDPQRKWWCAHDSHAQHIRYRQKGWMSYRENEVRPDGHDSTEHPHHEGWCMTARENTSSGSSQHERCGRSVGPGCSPGECLATDSSYSRTQPFCRDDPDANRPQSSEKIYQTFNAQKDRRHTTGSEHNWWASCRDRHIHRDYLASPPTPRNQCEHNPPRDSSSYPGVHDATDKRRNSTASINYKTEARTKVPSKMRRLTQDEVFWQPVYATSD